jgi:hypothetical protein
MKKSVRLSETKKVTERINALEYVKAPNPVPVYLHDEIILDMLKEYHERLEYLNMAKEYMVHFEGGGWNTCYGCDEEEAFDNAVLEYGASVHTQVRSVSPSTEAGKEAAMRLFY